jgi:hypothetical protein
MPSCLLLAANARGHGYRPFVHNLFAARLKKVVTTLYPYVIMCAYMNCSMIYRGICRVCRSGEERWHLRA